VRHGRLPGEKMECLASSYDPCDDDYAVYAYRKIYHKYIYPLLSCADIEELLAHFLPRRDVREEEVIFQLEQRHKQRQRAIESHARCRRK